MKLNVAYILTVCPVLGIAAECPSEDEIQDEHDCKHDKDCLGNKICCKDFCHLKCVG